MSALVSRAVNAPRTVPALRGAWPISYPPPPTTCTRPAPHVCTVNGPCNGYPRWSEGETYRPSDQSDRYYCCVVGYGHAPSRLRRLARRLFDFLVGAVVVGLIASTYLGAVWALCGRR